MISSALSHITLGLQRVKGIKAETRE